MVLSHGAAGDQRATLKDAYARSWGLAQSITNAGVSDQWLKVAREALSNLDVRNPELLEEMRSATILAKLNEVKKAENFPPNDADNLPVLCME